MPNLIFWAIWSNSAHTEKKIFVKHYAPGGNKVRKLNLQVTKSLTLMSFESVSLVEYASQIKVHNLTKDISYKVKLNKFKMRYFVTKFFLSKCVQTSEEI